MAEENNETLKEQVRYKKKFDPFGFTIALILVGVITIVAMNFMTPTIENVYEYGPALDDVDMGCVNHNCPNCWELNYDTGWCSDCLNKCSSYNTRQIGRISVILSAIILILHVTKEHEEKSKRELWLGFILLVLGIVIILLGQP